MGAAGTPSSTLIDLYRSDELTDDVRGRILIELGERGDPEVYDFVTEIIREDEEAQTNLQRFAVDTLGKLGDPRGLPTILAQFDSNDALTRAYAVGALTNFDTPESNEALIAALRDEFWRVRVAALEAIKERNLSDAAPAVMYKARQDPERQVRLAAISTMASLNTADGWELLEERVLSDRTALEERSAILDVMMNERLGRSIDLVLQVMEQEWDRENSRVLDVIGRIASRMEDQRIEPVAQRLLDHPNYILQIYGTRAVGRSRLASLIPIVEARQGEGTHPALRSAAVRALEQLGPR
jgi:HEAT repeat protein